MAGHVIPILSPTAQRRQRQRPNVLLMPPMQRFAWDIYRAAGTKAITTEGHHLGRKGALLQCLPRPTRKSCDFNGDWTTATMNGQ
jgi:hypothetical protein